MSDVSCTKMHIGVVHYKDKLSQLCGKNDNTCTLCQTNFGLSKSKLLIHLISQHKAIDEYIPNLDHLKIPPKQKLNSSVATQIPVKRKIGITKYKCHICGDKHSFERTNLFAHYAVVHYLQELKEMYPESSDNHCSICSRSFTTQKFIYSHYARSHDALKGIIPEISSLQIETNPELVASRKNLSRVTKNQRHRFFKSKKQSNIVLYYQPSEDTGSQKVSDSDFSQVNLPNQDISSNQTGLDEHQNTMLPNSQNQTGLTEESNYLHKFVTMPCPQCNEIYQRKDLGNHIKTCIGKSDLSHKGSSQSEHETKETFQDSSNAQTAGVNFINIL